MFAELYFAIMSSVHTTVAPIFSVIVTFHALFGIFCYFGLNSSKFIQVCQSYCATYKLSAIALGYLFEHIVRQGFNFEISFLLMTLVLTFDAFLGFSLLTARSEFCKDTKNLIFQESLQTTILADNWKSCQFKSTDVTVKNLAFVLISFECVFAVSAVFTLSGIQVRFFNCSYLLYLELYCYCCKLLRHCIKLYLFQYQFISQSIAFTCKI